MVIDNRNDWEYDIDDSKIKDKKDYDLKSIYNHAHSELSLQHELAGKEENTAFIIAEYKNYIQILNALIQKIENKEY